MRYQDKIESIREWEDTVANQEFKYPMWFKSKSLGFIVRFDGLTRGEVIVEAEVRYIKGYYSSGWTEHTAKDVWEQVENPSKDLDSIVSEAIKEVANEESSSINNGGKTDYYQLNNAPFPINDFDDFAEWRGLNGNQFNMGKVMWTFNIGRHNGTDYERDLNKIIHYANRELLRISREFKKDNK